MAIDYTTPVGKVRLHTADLNEASFLMADDLVQAYVDAAGGNVLLAAADALDAMATTESLISKVIKTQDVSTDGTKVAADLRKKADQLRARAAAEAAPAAQDEEDFFFYVPFRGQGPLEAEERWL